MAFGVVTEREDAEHLGSGGWRDGGDEFAEPLVGLWQVHRGEHGLRRGEEANRQVYVPVVTPSNM